MSPSRMAVWFFAGSELILVPASSLAASLLRDMSAEYMRGIILIYSTLGALLAASLFAAVVQARRPLRRWAQAPALRYVGYGALFPLGASALLVGGLELTSGTNPPTIAMWFVAAAGVGAGEGLLHATLRNRHSA